MATKYIVHLLRGGAPDKAMFNITDSTIQLIKHDHTNLVNYTGYEINSLAENEYILPADEGDIKYANSLPLNESKATSRVLLPSLRNGSIINYNEFVPKNSYVYQWIADNKFALKYAPFKSLTYDQLLIINPNDLNKVAVKSVTGSGSRGVWLIDPDNVHLGGKYVSKLSKLQFDQFTEFCKKENYCDAIIQDLIPEEASNGNKLLKCNVDFIIRYGRLISYKWDIVNQAQRFTNWDNLEIIRNPYTEKVMSNIAHLLIHDLDISNGILNFECFSDCKSETWLVEFNWRLSNSIFEYQAFGVDPISLYINNTSYFTPMGRYKAIRYWQCTLVNSIPNFIEGK